MHPVRHSFGVFRLLRNSFIGFARTNSNILADDFINVFQGVPLHGTTSENLLNSYAAQWGTERQSNHTYFIAS